MTVGFAVVLVTVIAYVNGFGTCHELVVASSKEKYELLRDIARTYEAPPVERRCVRVRVIEKASGEAEQALARGWDARIDGGPRPDVWWPAAKSWVLLLRQHRNDNKLDDIVSVVQTVMQSYLVIAMPQQMHETLTQSGREIGWTDVFELAKAPEGWARYGKPWGRFRLGKTNPTISTSGLHALIGTYNAAPASNRIEFVKAVESSVVHYGDTVATFLWNLYAADERKEALSYVSAVAVEEKQVFDYNRGNPRSKCCDPVPEKPSPNEKLIAIYPKEGTLIADHPYVVLNWVDRPHRDAANDFLEHLQRPAVQQRFLGEGFRNHLGEASNLLAPPYFERLPRVKVLPAEPQLVEIQRSWSALRRRAQVVAILDVGVSMGETVSGQSLTKLELAKRATVEALADLASCPRSSSLSCIDDDRVAVWTFPASPGGGRPYREVAPLLRLDADKSELVRLIDGLAVESGPSQLYATVRASVDHLRSRFAADRINAVIVLTDGGDETGDELLALLEYLQKQGEDERIRVFTVAYGPSATGTLRLIAERSRGAFYDAPNPSTITKVLRQVISNF